MLSTRSLPSRKALHLKIHSRRSVSSNIIPLLMAFRSPKHQWHQVEREFILDIDLTDYQDDGTIQTNCVDPSDPEFKKSFRSKRSFSSQIAVKESHQLPAQLFCSGSWPWRSASSIVRCERTSDSSISSGFSAGDEVFTAGSATSERET